MFQAPSEAQVYLDTFMHGLYVSMLSQILPTPNVWWRLSHRQSQAESDCRHHGLLPQPRVYSWAPTQFIEYVGTASGTAFCTTLSHTQTLAR